MGEENAPRRSTLVFDATGSTVVADVDWQSLARLPGGRMERVVENPGTPQRRIVWAKDHEQPRPPARASAATSRPATATAARSANPFTSSCTSPGGGAAGRVQGDPGLITMDKARAAKDKVEELQARLGGDPVQIAATVRLAAARSRQEFGKMQHDAGVIDASAYQMLKNTVELREAEVEAAAAAAGRAASFGPVIKHGSPA